MADSFTPSLNLRKPEVGAAHDTWGGLAGLNGDLDLIDAIFLATGLGTSVGLHIGTGKVANIEGQLQIADSTDTTKRTTFSADLIPTATTIDLKIPPVGGTIATKEIMVATLTAAHPVGTILSGYYGPVPPSGYVFLDGRTIGDATSGATRANLDCERLFKHLWAITAQAQCPVLTSAGAASTRGASAQADWDAHKRFTLPNHSGRTTAGRDNLSGAAASILNWATTLGATGGLQTHHLGSSEMPLNSAGGQILTNGNTGSGITTLMAGPDVPIYAAGAGTGGGPHNNTQPTVAVDVVIAL